MGGGICIVLVERAPDSVAGTQESIVVGDTPWSVAIEKTSQEPSLFFHATVFIVF